MQIVAVQKYIRQAPRKMRLVANQVKGLSLELALRQLSVIPKRSTVMILKVMRQALANAQHNHGLNLNELTLKNILVEEGPRYKRWNAVSRGRAHSIVKRTSHVQVILEAKKELGATEAKKAIKPKKEVKATAVKQAEVKKKNSKVQAVVKPVREIKQLRNEKLNKAVSAKGRSTFGGRKSTSK